MNKQQSESELKKDNFQWREERLFARLLRLNCAVRQSQNDSRRGKERERRVAGLLRAPSFLAPLLVSHSTILRNDLLRGSARDRFKKPHRSHCFVSCSFCFQTLLCSWRLQSVCGGVYSFVFFVCIRDH